MPKKNGKKGSKKGGSRKSASLRLRENSAEFYAEVLRPLGDGQMKVQILNGSEDTAKLKGSMRKGRGFEKVTPGNWVLIQLDESTTGKDKYWIIHRYNDSEKKQLEKLGELKSISEKKEVSTFIFEGEEEQVAAVEQEVDDDFIDDI